MAEKGREEKITRKPDPPDDKSFHSPGLPEEGEKALSNDPPSTIIRGEDVLTILRSQGIAI